MLNYVVWGLSSHDIGSLVLRFAMGLFFASAGYHKLFVPDVRRKFLGLMTSLGQNTPINRWLIPGAEFLGGIALMAGFLSTLAAAGLIVIMIGAICLTCWKEVVAKHPRDLFDWCAKAIYMPEGLMVVVLVAIMILGPGMFSADYLIDAHLL